MYARDPSLILISATGIFQQHQHSHQHSHQHQRFNTTSIPRQHSSLFAYIWMKDANFYCSEEVIGSQATKGKECEIRHLILKTLQLLVYDFGY
jgi:hypothetical protein